MLCTRSIIKATSEVINDMADTTQRVSTKTLEEVKKIGQMGDTFDSVILRLIKEHYELETLKKKR